MPPTLRLTWIDTVKGIAVILVVLYHAVSLAQDKSWSGDQLSMLTSALLTVRMPLFFAMSGFFILRRVDRPWSWQLRNRIGPFLWLFILWTAVWLLVFDILPWHRAGDSGTTSLQDIVRLLVDPSIGPWYIYALAIYIIAVKLMRPLPVWLQFLLGATVSLPVACGVLTIDSWVWTSLLSHFIAFQIGALAHRTLSTIADHATLWWLLGYGALWGGCTAALFFLDLGLDNLARIPVTLLGMAMGITAAVLIDRHAPFLKLAWVGKNTLPIYLLHVPLLGAVYSLGLGLPSTAVVAVGVPVLCTVLAVAGALLIWRVTRRVPGIYIAPWTGDGANTRNIPTTPSRPGRGDRRDRDADGRVHVGNG